MEIPTRIPNNSALPPERTLSPSSSGRRFSTDSNSPEFEFWRIRNPSSFAQSELLSADELFSGGVLLPLHLLSLPQPDSEPTASGSDPDQALVNPDPGQDIQPDDDAAEVTVPPAAAATGDTESAVAASKRWRDIFKKNEKKPEEKSENRKNRKKEKKGQGQGGSGGPAELNLNINIWPFRRSRSAGNNGSRPRMALGPPATRKVSSAPCSRSNSGGESKSRKWPSSPGRAGVHLGRSSPVWQIKRGSSGVPKSSDPISRVSEKNERNRRNNPATASTGVKTRVLNLNVPMCIGYRQHLSCRGGDSSAIAVGTASGSSGGGGDSSGALGTGGSNNLFNLRGLFTKKVY